MAVKIRLARRGRKQRPIYDVVVADARAPRDGRFIEKIGKYNPNTDPATIELDDAKAFDWVMKGAQPTDTVRAMLSYKGIMLKKHLQVGVNKGAITQEEADKKFEAWLSEKEGKIQAKRDKLAEDAATSAKARKDAEARVKEARAEALKKKADAAAAEEAPAEEEVASEEGVEAPAEATAEEAPVVEASTETSEAEEVVEEAPAAEEEVTAEAPTETAAPAEEAKEEAPAQEAEAEETPAAETAPEEAPAAEVKEEAPKAETKEEEVKEDTSEDSEKKES